jgi:hypothetical protein
MRERGVTHRADDCLLGCWVPQVGAGGLKVRAPSTSSSCVMIYMLTCLLTCTLESKGLRLVSCPWLQEAACGVLEALAAVKPSLVTEEVSKVRDRFRAKHYCDRVLAACK